MPPYDAAGIISLTLSPGRRHAVWPIRCCSPRHRMTFESRHEAANRPVSVYRFPRRALTLCPYLCMGNHPCARIPAPSDDALPATLYGHFTQAIHRNRPVALHDLASNIYRALRCGSALGTGILCSCTARARATPPDATCLAAAQQLLCAAGTIRCAAA
jgi:hypothetical protein